MRRLAVLVLAPALAHADPVPKNVELELGLMWDRVALSDQTSIDGRLVRFGFRVAVGAIHFGGEVDDSWLQGTTRVADGAIARTMTVQAGSPLTGTMVAPKAFVGVHTSAHAFAFAAELATGVRDTSVSADWGDDIAGRKLELLVEARTRIDWWFQPSWSLALIGAADVRVRDDLSLGLALASHM